MRSDSSGASNSGAKEESLGLKSYLLLCELFDNTLPVFVAATISRASTSIIELMSPTLSVAIGLTFVYAFCILQVIGIIVCTSFNHKSTLFNYYLHVVTECTGFGWKEFVTLILLRWLFIRKDIGAGFGAWLLICFIAFLMVYVFNAVLALYVRPPTKIYSVLRQFNTDAVALAIAFGFTLVIASEIYPTDSSSSLAGTDDIMEDPDDIEDGQRMGWIFALYAFGITLFVAVMQWKVAPLIDGHISRNAVTREEREDGKYAVNFNNVLDVDDSDDDEQVNTSPLSKNLNQLHADEVSHWRSIDSVDPNSHPFTGGKTGGIASSFDGTSGNAVIKPMHSSADTDDVFSTLNHCWSYVDNIIFAWDSKGYCKSSLAHLLNTTGGYTVGCGWYTFALLTFQNIFLFLNGGQILGMFIYAIIMTLAVVALMGWVQGRQQGKWEKQMERYRNDPTMTDRDLAKFNARYKRNTELALVSGRLLCGWSWSDFITSCATVFLRDNGRGEQYELTTFRSSNWVGCIVKVLLALIVFVGGALLEKYMVTRKAAREAVTSSFNGQAGSTSVSRSSGEYRKVEQDDNGKDDRLESPLL